MTTEDISGNLCYYDRRNPYNVYEEEDIVEHEKMILKSRCMCDNCFYGRTELANELLKIRTATSLIKGFPTHTKDINGEVICLGDTVDYAFDGDQACPFEVVFEENAFRKKYKKWDKTLPKPLLEYGHRAEKMRLKIVKKYTANIKKI